MTTGSETQAKVRVACTGPGQSWAAPDCLAHRRNWSVRSSRWGDGLSPLVSRLPNVQLDELLHFEKGQFGFAQVLERGPRRLRSAGRC